MTRSNPKPSGQHAHRLSSPPSRFPASFSFPHPMIRLALATALVAFSCCEPFAAETAAPPALKTEHFDADPGWEGVNNRRTLERAIKQDFGYSATANAGAAAGEIGGFITPAAEPAYYAKTIPACTLGEPITASGSVLVERGAGNTLLGFFNAGTLNEWRTPNTFVLRLNGRGEKFYAYVEYCTRRWRAGGHLFDTLGPDGKTKTHQEFPVGVVHQWSLTYDPKGHGGSGAITASIGGQTVTALLEPGHQADGAEFNRFGLLNVMKSADGAGSLWVDDVTLDGVTERFDRDPSWESSQSRRSYSTKNIIRNFDFGFSPTRHAGGKAAGEMGGLTFRGDCRKPGSMASYGDRLGPLNLDHPLHASGKVSMRRGVTDSTTLIGFYHSADSMTLSPSQSSAIPKSFLGAAIEGPSSEGFYFYPMCRSAGDAIAKATGPTRPRIAPDGASHDWTLEYSPQESGKLTLTLDRQTVAIAFDPKLKARGARFDRFGIVTTWIDANGQHVYFDDLTYTAAPPSTTDAPR